MPSVVFYFELHQPFRLRRYSVFDTDPFYFDNEANERILRKVADKCYRPTTLKLLDLVRRHDRRFRVSFSVSGTALKQLEDWAPDVLDTLRRLVEAACKPPSTCLRNRIRYRRSRPTRPSSQQPHHAGRAAWAAWSSRPAFARGSCPLPMRGLHGR